MEITNILSPEIILEHNLKIAETGTLNGEQAISYEIADIKEHEASLMVASDKMVMQIFKDGKFLCEKEFQPEKLFTILERAKADFH